MSDAYKQYRATPVRVVNGDGSLDIRGLIAARPNADAVSAGSTFTAVDRVNETNFVSMSDGATWTDL